MILIDHIDGTLIRYSAWVSVVAVLLGGSLYFGRKIIERRNEPKPEIPPFLRKDIDPTHDYTGVGEGNADCIICRPRPKHQDGR